jgi:hypothetical protein
MPPHSRYHDIGTKVVQKSDSVKNRSTPLPTQKPQPLQRVLQLPVDQMGVNLRGRNITVPQRPLNNEQVVRGSTEVREKGSEKVPERNGASLSPFCSQRL